MKVTHQKGKYCVIKYLDQVLKTISIPCLTRLKTIRILRIQFNRNQNITSLIDYYQMVYLHELK
jgi:hypothetical protein